MKVIVAKILINIYKLIPSKKIKQKIRNKVYYSNKLSDVFMYNEKHHEGYKYGEIYTLQTHYFDGKIAVSLNISKNSDLKIIKEFLLQIPYNFDLYIYSNEKIDYKILTKNNIYLGKVYSNIVDSPLLKTNLLLTKYNASEYKYVLNINTYLNSYNEDRIKLLTSKKYILKNLLYIMNLNSKVVNLSEDDIIKFKLIPQEVNTTLFANTIADLQLKPNDLMRDEDENSIINSVALVNTEFVNRCTIESNDDYELTSYLFNKINKLLLIKNNENKVNYNVELNQFCNVILKNDNFDLNDLINISKPFDIISFDIFDTLVTRKIYNPDSIFDLMNININEIDNFKEIRKKAEMLASQKYNHDVNIDEIYDEMSELLDIDKNKINGYKKIEIEYEKRLIIPRKEMIDYYNQMKKLGKKIILVSDMYLTKEIIKEILVNVGIDNFDDLIVSNDVNFRKDTGTMWDFVNERYNVNILHIGDNINSDVYQALKHNIFAFKINSGLEISKQNLKLECNNVYESLLYGNILNKYLYNSPFYNNEQLNINNYHEYGFCILSPIFIYFYSWLLNIITLNKNQHLLFVARDGYYLKKIYEYILKSKKYNDIKNIKYDYFLTSRRASSIAAVENENDLYEILKTDYNGTLLDLFYYRYGVKMNCDNREIHLPKDLEFVKNVIKNNKQIFLDEAKNEKDNYFKYINSVEPKIDDYKLSLVDLGYSGTAQYYISKLIGKKTNGYYFVTTSNLKPLKLECNVDSCFKDNIEIKDYLYKKSLFLESFLTAPFGQLEKFDSDSDTVIPIYNNSTNDAITEQLELLYGSIISAFDIFEDYNIDIRNIQLSQTNIYELFKKFVQQTNDGNFNFLNKLFKFEDYYCNNGIVDVSKR